MDRRAQRDGETNGPGGADCGGGVADEKSLVKYHRSQMAAWQASDCRSDAGFERGGGGGAGLRLLWGAAAPATGATGAGDEAGPAGQNAGPQRDAPATADRSAGANPTGRLNTH